MKDTVALAGSFDTKGNEYSFVKDLLKTKDLKKQILSFDINSKRKIVLISLKKNIKKSDLENLGGK